jgi:hypothetical protein
VNSVTLKPSRAIGQKQQVFKEDGFRYLYLNRSIVNIRDGPDRVNHYICLGGMIHSFSMIETATAWLLAAISGVDKQTIKAIVYPLRIDNAISTIKRTITTKRINGKRIEEIIQTLDQLQKINKARNDLLHIGAHFQEGDLYFKVSNQTIAYHPSISRHTKMSNLDLMRMQHDLTIITAVWLDYVMWKTRSKTAGPKGDYAYNMARAVRKARTIGSPIPGFIKFANQRRR